MRDGPLRRWLSLGLGGVVAVGLVYVVAETAAQGAVDLAMFLDPENLAVALGASLLVIAGIVVRAVRWTVLLGAQPGVSWGRLIFGFAWCFLVLQALPFRTGEAVRPLWLKREGGSGTAAVSSLIVERLLDIAVLALILLGVLAAVPVLETGIATGWFVAAALALGVAGLVGLATLAPRFAALCARGPAHGFRGVLAAAAEHLAAASRMHRMLPAALLSVVAWGLTGSGFALLLGHLLAVDPVAAFAVLAGVNLSALVTLAPGNLGVFEAAAVAVLVAFGVPAGAALVAAVLLHLCVLAATAIIGFAGRLLLLRGDRQRRTIGSARE